jgi:hypothetical protein
MERTKMNKILHAVVTLVFAGACFFLGLMLKLPLMVQPMAAKLPSISPGQSVLPAFTRLCMAAGPSLLATLALLALGYCIYVCLRRSERPMPWVGFLATTMSAVVLIALPTIVAIYLPLIAFLNLSGASLK